MGIIIQVFRRSSMVEQEAVNFEVAGSSPAVGAIEKSCELLFTAFFLCFVCWIGTSNRSAKRCLVAVRTCPANLDSRIGA